MYELNLGGDDELKNSKHRWRKRSRRPRWRYLHPNFRWIFELLRKFKVVTYIPRHITECQTQCHVLSRLRIIVKTWCLSNHLPNSRTWNLFGCQYSKANPKLEMIVHAESFIKHWVLKATKHRAHHPPAECPLCRHGELDQSTSCIHFSHCNFRRDDRRRNRWLKSHFGGYEHCRARLEHRCRHSYLDLGPTVGSGTDTVSFITYT